jgi:hypothetical protein
MTAACLGLTDMFFDDDTVEEAKTCCATCPLRKQCLSEELARNKDQRDGEIHGVYGGLSSAERIAILPPEHIRFGRTHCFRGHELTPENIYKRPGSNNSPSTCRICKRARNREADRRAAARKRQEQ